MLNGYFSYIQFSAWGMIGLTRSPASESWVWEAILKGVFCNPAIYCDEVTALCRCMDCRLQFPERDLSRKANLKALFNDLDSRTYGLVSLIE